MLRNLLYFGSFFWWSPMAMLVAGSAFTKHRPGSLYTGYSPFWDLCVCLLPGYRHRYPSRRRELARHRTGIFSLQTVLLITSHCLRECQNKDKCG